MTGPQLIDQCSKMTSQELIAFVRGREARVIDQWPALAFCLASKLESELVEHTLKALLAEISAPFDRTPDTVLAASAADWSVPDDH